jgi:hypothetical protein
MDAVMVSFPEAAVNSAAERMRQSDKATEKISAGQLAALAARFGTPAQPPELEVQKALEHGFGYVMALEARRQRTRSETGDHEADPAADERQMLAEIGSIWDALRSLQAASERRQPPRLPAGFVLPARKP